MQNKGQHDFKYQNQQVKTIKQLYFYIKNLNDLKQNKKYYKKRPKRYEKTYIEINKLIIKQMRDAVYQKVDMTF